MKSQKYSLWLFLFIILASLPGRLPAFCNCGKVDLGAAYIHIDVLESNQTIKRMDLAGIKADATIMIMEDKGWCLKPSILLGANGSREIGNLATAGLGFGHCFPFYDCFCITPSVGVIYGRVNTTIRIPLLGLLTGEEYYREHFKSFSTYVAVDATYKICDRWRICGMFQYAWSNTKTTIVHVLTDKSSAKGPSYSAQLEYDINDKWTAQLGAAYNISLSKEKHGIRAAGVKLGMAYWF